MALDPRISLLGRGTDLSLQPFFAGAQAMGQMQSGLLSLQDQQRQMAEAAQVREAYRQQYGQLPGAPPGLAGVQPAGDAPVQERHLGGGPTAAFPYATAPSTAGAPGQTPQGGLLAQGGGMGLPTPTGDAFVRKLYTISPAAGREAEAHAWQSQKNQMDHALERTKYLAQVAQGILAGDSQQAYDVGKAMLAQAGMPTSEMPAIYDRTLVQQWYTMGQTSVDRLNQAKAAHEQAQIARMRSQAPDYGLGQDLNAVVYDMFGGQIPPGSQPTPAQVQQARARQIQEEGQRERDKAWAQKEAELGTTQDITTARERGKLAAEQPALQRKTQSQLRQLERQWQTTEEDIDRALAITDDESIIKLGETGTGIFGGAAAYVPGTKAYDLRQLLETIRANVGFDRLQQMREASPTGGALGQVSDAENRLLQSTAGSLDPKQSREQLQRNLRRIKADIAALREDRRQAFASQFGTTSPRSGRAPAGGTPSRGTPRPLPTTPEAVDQRIQEIERQLQQGR